MNSFLIVKDGSVVGTVQSDLTESYQSLHDGESVMHLILPEGETPDTVDVVDGAIVPNAEKKSAKLATEARALRDQLLAETDYTDLPHCSASVECKALFVQYREDLKNLSAQEGFPGTINWPTKPEYVKG